MWGSNLTDLADQVLYRIEDEYEYLYYKSLASYAGVGSPVRCSPQIERMLTGMSEWEKTGMAAATTLMALLPTFLAFGNL